MKTSYEYQERIAICMDSGMDLAAATRVADSELPKTECEAVNGLKTLREKMAEGKPKKRGFQYE